MSIYGIYFLPEAEGMSEAEGEMAPSGVEASEGVSFEEAAGELAGGVDEVEGPLAPASTIIKSAPNLFVLLGQYT